MSSVQQATATLSSMTGFGRSAGQWRDTAWAWELKSVNGKALDLRFRTPPGLDALEAQCRAAAGQSVKRGNVQISLTLTAQTAETGVTVNWPLLDQLASVAEDLRKRLNGAPIQAEQLLALRGVLEAREHVLDEAAAAERDAALLTGFVQAVAALARNRLEEGARLAAVIAAQLERIAHLTEAARANPSRSSDAIRKRLSEQVAKLMEQSETLDPQRLHQEAILLATKADIQEELDRLASHITAARQLLASHEPVGRKFDFLAQEFNREANTLCSKANDPALTSIGLDLKTVIDQLREQVQNFE